MARSGVLDEDGSLRECNLTWILQTLCKHAMPCRTDLSVPRPPDVQPEPSRTRSNNRVITDPCKKYLRAVSRLTALAREAQDL